MRLEGHLLYKLAEVDFSGKILFRLKLELLLLGVSGRRITVAAAKKLKITPI